MLVAEDKEGECCGFIFAIPDYQQLQRGEKLSRLIVKTLAVSAKRRSAGLGSILVEEVQKKAIEKGFTEAIHALMYSQNNSTNIGKFSRVMRRYTLYKKELT
jgi:predicted N-acetyltransferase YhbS